jgi:hypothetical protein
MPASYRAVLALPHARAPFAAATLARLCYGLQGLPLLITLLNATSSYALSGAAAAAFGLGAALLGPARARLVARHPRALALLAGGYAFAPVTAGAALCLAGAGADILLVTTYQLVDAGVPQARRAEAGAWLNTAYNLGAALGTAAGGVLAGSAGPRLSFAVIAGLTGLCAAAAWSARGPARRL